MDILFKDITVITMNDEKPVLFHAYVGVKDGKIAYVGEKCPADSAARVIDGKRKLLMPGLINSHSHTPMALLRGYADDYVLQEWLFSHVIPAEDKLDARCIRAGAELALAEAIRFGTVSSTEMYYHLPQIAEAVFAAGTKINLTNALLCMDRENYDFENDRSTQEVREVLGRFKGKSEGRIKVDAGIHAEYTSSPDMWRDSIRFAQQNDLNFHIHLSETEFEHTECVKKYGKTPAEVLFEAGVFTRKTTAAHCCWVSERDMEIMAQNGVTAVHNPVSNLKLASGVAPVMKMQQYGVNVALGTDGVCSNNNHDLFEEMKFAALLQKNQERDASVMPAYAAIKLATVNGALGQGRETETGAIAEGFDADMIMLNLDAPHLIPSTNPCSTVVYAAKGSDVCLTMVQGRVLYENGEYKTIDLERAIYEVENYVLPILRG